jgi:hypothetical protein
VKLKEIADLVEAVKKCSKRDERDEKRALLFKTVLKDIARYGHPMDMNKAKEVLKVDD